MERRVHGGSCRSKMSKLSLALCVLAVFVSTAAIAHPNPSPDGVLPEAVELVQDGSDEEAVEEEESEAEQIVADIWCDDPAGCIIIGRSGSGVTEEEAQTWYPTEGYESNETIKVADVVCSDEGCVALVPGVLEASQGAELVQSSGSGSSGGSGSGTSMDMDIDSADSGSGTSMDMGSGSGTSMDMGSGSGTSMSFVEVGSSGSSSGSGTSMDMDIDSVDSGSGTSMDMGSGSGTSMDMGSGSGTSMSFVEVGSTGSGGEVVEIDSSGSGTSMSFVEVGSSGSGEENSDVVPEESSDDEVEVKADVYCGSNNFTTGCQIITDDYNDANKTTEIHEGYEHVGVMGRGSLGGHEDVQGYFKDNGTETGDVYKAGMVACEDPYGCGLLVPQEEESGDGEEESGSEADIGDIFCTGTDCEIVITTDRTTVGEGDTLQTAPFAE